MADFRLPELKPAQVDYPNAFARGYASVDQMQTPGLTNALSQAKLTEEQNQLASAKEYAATGDPTSLRGGYPVQSLAFDTAEHKRRIDEMKPGLEYAYMISPMLTPENYKYHRQKAVGMSQALDAIFPPDFDQAKIAAFQKAYEKGKRLEKPTNYTYDDEGNLIPVGQGRVFNPPRVPLTPEEIAANAKARAEGNIAGGGGRSARGGGRQDVITEARMFNEEYLKWAGKPENAGKTRQEFRPIWDASRLAGRGTTTTTTDSRGRTKSTERRPIAPPGPSTDRDKVLGQIGSGIGQPYMMPPNAPAPPPAGQTNLGDPIGKTPAGKLIYKGADGRPITID